MDNAVALLAENAALGELLRDADLSIPVPTCPEWSLEKLMLHVGRGDRWCAQIVAERSADYIDARTVPGGTPPAGRDNMVTWFGDGARRLVDAVGETGAATPVWTFLGPRPAGWWIRRRLHETLVHRADAALALGSDFDVDPAVAADAVTENLERVVIRAAEAGSDAAERPLLDGQSLHLHATDPGLGTAGEWTILANPTGLTFDHQHGSATAVLRGPARDLLLAMVRRGSTAELDIEMYGDPAVWVTWLARTPF